MKNHTESAVIFIIISILLNISCATQEKVDILIIGGGASGVAAGIQSARMGSSTVIVEETAWLGGMLTSSGVSAIDGNYKLPAGFFGEFRDSLVAHYGSLDALKTGWVSGVQFEPSVGNSIFQQMVSREKLKVYFLSRLLNIKKINNQWHAEIEQNGKLKHIVAQVLIDATELGDIAKMCDVPYNVGMDSREITGEEIAPIKANHIIQDLTYVAILKDYKKDVTIPRPEGYNPDLFACACINPLCTSPKEPNRLWGAKEMITYGKLPNNKYMINWPIEGNDYYLNLIDLSQEERTEELKKAKHFTLCFLYFLQHEIGYNTLGLADDEFPTQDLLPIIPYHRESRRINGEVCFTLNHITDPYSQPEKLYRTTIAVGDYPVDHHHMRYNGSEDLPDLHFYPVPSYGLPLGTLIPQKVENLIVAEKSISVTNLVNGTTRLQPVVMQIGQAAGIIASLSVQKGTTVRNITVRDVQRSVLANGGYLLPYLDVEKSDSLFQTYQRIGATGILKGEGKNVGWSNETWFRHNDPLLVSEIEGLKEVYSFCTLPPKNTPLNLGEAISILTDIAKNENLKSKVDITNLTQRKDSDSIITRGEFAVLVDKLLDPFNNKEVDIKGNYK